MTELVRKTIPSPAPRDAKGDHARLLAAARADLSLVQKRRTEIAEAFYDIGQALSRLRRDPIPKLLGYRSFGRLCRDRLGISLATADKLILIAERVSRENALRWGKEKSAALVDLAIAAGNNGPITKRKLALDPDRVTTREIRAEAKRRRAQRGARTSRGRTVAASEREVAASLERALHREGVKSATVTAVANVPGKPSFLRIERVPCTAVAKLRKALSAMG